MHCVFPRVMKALSRGGAGKGPGRVRSQLRGNGGLWILQRLRLIVLGSLEPPTRRSSLGRLRLSPSFTLSNPMRQIRQATSPVPPHPAFFFFFLEMSTVQPRKAKSLI